MGKTSFQSLNQLVENIAINITKLNNGQLKNSEIEDLTTATQELYQRVIVIRHKAYEKFGNPNQTLNSPNSETEKTNPLFDLSADNTVQTPVTEPEENLIFDFSEPNQPENEQIITETGEKSKTEPAPLSKIKETKSLNDIIADSSESLNDAFKSSNSLADKLKQTKINDLKQHIGINKKFSFISGLFNGNNEAYNNAISKLNSCNDSDQAREMLSNLSTQNNWDVENETVIKFVDLVERRYL